MNFPLSITGLFKMILLIIGVFALLKYIGQLMQAKRNIEEEKKWKNEQKKIKKHQDYIQKNKGKVNLVKEQKVAEDVDYEELT